MSLPSLFSRLVAVITLAFGFAYSVAAVTQLRLADGNWTWGFMALILVLWVDRRWPVLRFTSKPDLNSFTVSGIKALWLIFSTVFAHLVGASVGREGVALQLGQAFGVSSRSSRILGALAFSVVFGAPLTAAAFFLEKSGLDTSASRPRTVRLIGLSSKQNFAVLADSGFVLGLGLALDLLYKSQITSWLFQLHYDPFEDWFLRFPVVQFDVYRELSHWVENGLGTALALMGLLIFVPILAVSFRRLQNWFAQILNKEKSETQFLLVAALTVLSLQGIHMLGRMMFGSDSVLDGLGFSQSLFDVQSPSLVLGLKLILTAAATGIGLRGGSVTPLLAIGLLLGVVLAQCSPETALVIVTLSFASIWATLERIPVAGALLVVELSPSVRNVFSSATSLTALVLSCAFVITILIWLSDHLERFRSVASKLGRARPS